MVKVTTFDAAEYLESAEDVANYLTEAFETGDASFIAHAIGTVARAQGMAAIAKQSGLSRENLYRALSPDGHPEFETVIKVLQALGVQLVATPVGPRDAA